MQPTTETPTDEPRFDVSVSLPTGRRLEDVARLAVEAGVRKESVDALMAALRNGPRAKIGAGVNRERADRARDQFSRAGLHVDITPILSLAAITTGTFDGLSVCPGCNNRVKLPENRQCPSCGVFVDKVSEEALLRRKLREKEKMALDFRTARDKAQAEEAARSALEARLREEVRKQLEKEYGLTPEKRRRGKALAIAGACALAVLAFVGGRSSSMGWSMDSLAGMVPEFGKPSAAKSGPAGGNTAAAAAANGGPATGDPDVDDPLVQAAGGKRIGAPGISIEQAVAAAQTLAKSVGYKEPGTQTAVSTPGADAPAAAGAAAAGAAPAAAGSPGGSASGGSASGAAGTAAAGGATAAAGAATAAGTAIPVRLRTQLALDLTRLMAELGQVPRSRELLRGLRAAPATKADPASALAAQVVDIEVRAWALHTLAPANRKSGAEQLATAAQGIQDPMARTRALIQSAVIVARQPDMPTDAARLLLTRATEALKTLDAPTQLVVMSDWAVALGETLTHEAAARARTGQWARAAELSHQIEAMIAQAPDPLAAARLHALDARAKQVTGQTDKASKALAASLALAAREPDLVKRARLLQSLAALSGLAADAQMTVATEAVQAAAMGKAGAERAQALGALALLYSEAGLSARAGDLMQQVLSTPKLSPAEAAELHADLLLRADMATARALQGIGLYADAEVTLRRLGNLLL